jgi:hypothetical protein
MMARPIARIPGRGTAFLLLVLAAAAGGGQVRSEDLPAGRSLIEALAALQAAGLNLIYSSDVVKPWMRVREEPAPGDPRAVLDELLAPHGLEARPGPGGTLLIVRGRGPEEAGVIEGVVRTALDRRPVAAARISVEGAAMHTTADAAGRFRLTGLRAGAYALVVSVPGLADERFEAVAVRPGRSTRVRLDLAASATLRERIVVTPARDGTPGGLPEPGYVLSGDEVRAVPGTGDDLHRAIASQPGLSSGDRSADFSVRGGDPGEVLVLFDGQELHDPFHLKAYRRHSGIIDAMIVGQARLFSEAFPADYGDRMSGVLDLSSSIPAAGGGTLVSSGFINSRLLADGGFHRDAGHWLVSARSWYPSAVVRAVGREEEFAPRYDDLFAKARVRLGQGTVLTGHLLAARDRLDFNDPDGDGTVGARSGTRYLWLTLDSFWSRRLHSRTVLSYGRAHGSRAGRVDEAPELVASVDDDRTLNVLGVMQNWTLRPSDRLELRWGVSAEWLEATYDYASRLEGGSPSWVDGSPTSSLNRSSTFLVSGRQLGAHATARVLPAASMSLEAGLRWDRQTYTGEAQVSPRLSLVQALGPAARVRASWGRHYQSQGPHELQVEDGVTEFFPAQMAKHYSLAYETEFDNGLALRATAYVKKFSDPKPRFENLFNPFELFPEFEPDRARIDADRAEARGFDVILSMDSRASLKWWGSYSRSAAEDEVDGRRVPRSWDQPHAFRFGIGYRPGPAWDIGLYGVYRTGWPTTPVGARSVRNPDGSTTIEPLLGPRNSDRFPDYHRLDLRVGRQFRLGRGTLTAFAEITNLYDRENVCCVDDIAFVAGADGAARVTSRRGLWMPRLPTLGIIWRLDR